jgi:hypothetical protein
MTYDDAHAWVESYVDGYNPIVSDESYGGTGSLYMQDGKLHWYNDVTGQLTVLVCSSLILGIFWTCPNG